MERVVKPELLDQLPACNIDAISSRQDLLKINRLMGNFAWIRRTLLRQSIPPNSNVVELGAGDGALAMQLIPRLPNNGYIAIDKAPRPKDWPDHAQWLRQDILREDSFQGATYLIANLILHHFENDALELIGRQINDSALQTLIISEPLRRRFHKLQLRSGKLIGFNHVTLHDGAVSIDAGFRGNELANLLQLDPTTWSVQIKQTWMGAYRLFARRK